MISKEVEKRLNRIEQAVGLQKGITEPATEKVRSSIVGPLAEIPKEEDERFDPEELLRKVKAMLDSRFDDLQGDVYEIIEEWIHNENNLTDARTFIRVTSPQIHKAFCKTDAGAGSTIVCYLDTDATGKEITVNCSISGGSALNTSIRALENGDLLEVVKHGSSWYALEGFQTFDTDHFQITGSKIQDKLDTC